MHLTEPSMIQKAQHWPTLQSINAAVEQMAGVAVGIRKRQFNNHSALNLTVNKTLPYQKSLVIAFRMILLNVRTLHCQKPYKSIYKL